MYWFKFMAVALVAGLVFPAADALLVTGPTEVAGQSILSPVACNYNFYALNGTPLRKLDHVSREGPKIVACAFCRRRPCCNWRRIYGFFTLSVTMFFTL